MYIPLKNSFSEHFELFLHYVVAAGVDSGVKAAPWCLEAERSADAHV